jgi:hypothetical protein
MSTIVTIRERKQRPNGKVLEFPVTAEDWEKMKAEGKGKIFTEVRRNTLKELPPTERTSLQVPEEIKTKRGKRGPNSDNNA